MAPEVLDARCGYVVTRGQDIWSLGIILYIMLVGDFPWMEASKSDNEYAAFLKSDYSMYPWNTFAPDLIQVHSFLDGLNSMLGMAALHIHPCFLTCAAF